MTLSTKLSTFAAVIPLTLATPLLAQTATPGRAPMTDPAAGGSAQPQTPAPTQAPAATATPAPTAPTVGGTVYDPTGGVVGTIESISGDSAVIATGTNRVGLPLASIGTGANGPTIALTKAQLDAQAASAQAGAAGELKSKLVAGTTVSARDGTTQLGTVKSADDQFVTLTTTRGDVRLPINGFGMGPNGVILGMTSNEFNAAVGGAAPR